MNPSNDQQHWTSALIVRFMQPSDQSECTKIFRDGSEEGLKQVIFNFVSSVSWYVIIATFFASAAALLWSIWIFVVHTVIIFVLVYPCIEWCYKFKNWQNSVLKRGFRNIEDGHVFVAELNGKVVGMVRLTHNDEVHGAGVAKLENMYVVPSYRRMGIGKKLLDELIAHAKKQRVKEIVLLTSNTLTAAIRLYKRHGFKVVSTEKMFYTKTELYLSLQL